jgi:hypothetical protein
MQLKEMGEYVEGFEEEKPRVVVGATKRFREKQLQKEYEAGLITKEEMDAGKIFFKDRYHEPDIVMEPREGVAVKKKVAKRYYKVGIDKVYFPEGTGYDRLSSLWEKPVEILAENRTEAVKLAWEKHGQRWLSKMRPQEGRLPRKISLQASDPSAGTGGIIGRLPPITVFREEVVRPKAEKPKELPSLIEEEIPIGEEPPVGFMKGEKAPTIEEPPKPKTKLRKKREVAPTVVNEANVKGWAADIARRVDDAQKGVAEIDWKKAKKEAEELIGLAERAEFELEANRVEFLDHIEQLPGMIHRAEVAAKMGDTVPRGALPLEKYGGPVETTIDKATRIEAIKRGAERQRMRSGKEIARDVKTLLDERGSISFEELSQKQKDAIYRLERDAKLIGKKLKDFLADMKFTPEEIMILQKHVAEMKKERSKERRKLRDVDFIPKEPTVEKGNPIVKRRQTKKTKFGRQMYAPVVRLKEIVNLAMAKDWGFRPFGGKFEPEFRKFIDRGIQKVGLRQYNKLTDQIARDQRKIGELWDKMDKEYTLEERVRVGIYGEAQTPEGITALRATGVTEIPDLTPHEMKLYNLMRRRYNAWHPALNQMRVNNGIEPFDFVPNYFTLSRISKYWRELGLEHNSAYDQATNMRKRYIVYSKYPFRYEKRRKGGKYPIELDAVSLIRDYEMRSISLYHLTPLAAKV